MPQPADHLHQQSRLAYADRVPSRGGGQLELEGNVDLRARTSLLLTRRPRH
jgi:hypothetical protein